MKNTSKIIKLDLLAVRPYLTLKNFIIIVGLSMFYSYQNKNVFPVFGITQTFTIIFSSYPFLVGDEAGIDCLYSIFGIKRKDVVHGRYLWSNLASLAFLILGIIISLFLSFFIDGISFGKEALFSLPVWFFYSAFLISLQYPFFFKYGYSKSKLIMTSIILGLSALGFLIYKLAQKMEGYLNHLNPYIILTLVLMIIALIYIFSIGLSRKWYNERELA